MWAACTCTMRSHADENGVLHVTQCSHLFDDEDEEEDEELFAVVEAVEADSVEGDSSLTENLSGKFSSIYIIKLFNTVRSATQHPEVVQLGF